MDWRKFLTISTQHLGAPIETVKGQGCSDGGIPAVRSWCSWTTFGRLWDNAGYWTGSFPEVSELGERYVADGGTWGQPFFYDDLAHLIIPHRFDEEYPGSSARFATISPARIEFIQGAKKGFWMWTHTQDIDGLSKLLQKENIEHRLSEWALEVKLY